MAPPPFLQARVNIPDERFNWLVDLYKPKSIFPAFLEIVDIAGLVKGAAQGEGLGNAFLSHIMVRMGGAVKEAQEARTREQWRGAMLQHAHVPQRQALLAQRGIAPPLGWVVQWQLPHQPCFPGL